MRVIVEFHDSDSYTAEEVVKNAKSNYGKETKVTVHPDSSAPHDLILFGIQQIVTYKQLQLLFDKKYNYTQEINKLRQETLDKLKELLDDVIIENESKVGR